MFVEIRSGHPSQYVYSRPMLQWLIHDACVLVKLFLWCGGLDTTKSVATGSSPWCFCPDDQENSDPQKLILVLKKITQFGAVPPEFRCKFPGAYEQEFQGLRCLDGNRCSYHYSREVLYMFPSSKCGSTVYRPQRNLGMKLKPNWTSRGGVRKDFSGSHALIGIVLKVLKTKFCRRLPITHYQLSGTRIHMFSVHDEDRPWVNWSDHVERSNGGVHCSKKNAAWHYALVPYGMLWYAMVCSCFYLKSDDVIESALSWKPINHGD